MNIIVTFVNLFALLLGAFTVGIALRLLKNFQIPFLNYFLYFLICSVISGFFDWISFNWVVFLGADFSSKHVELVYHIFWDLIGFPAALFATFFLLSFLLRLVELPFKSTPRKLFLSIVFLLTFLSFVSLSFRIQKIDFAISYYLWIVFLYILPLFHLGILFFSFSTARRLKQAQRDYVQKFVLILFLGYSTWYFLMLYKGDLGIWRHFIIVVFYIALLLPTLYIRRFLQSQKSKVMFGSHSPNKLKDFLGSNNFTTRETEVINLIIDGKSNQQIADELFISLQTVKNYLSRIYKRLNLKSRLELVNYIRNWKSD